MDLMTEALQKSHSAVSDAPAPRLRLEFLDGLRGLAALYVVFYHASLINQINSPHQHLPGRLQKASQSAHFLFLTYGHYAVDVFIVLSGFCLMLPVARSAGENLPDGFGPYLRRRAQRILPPYYAALILSLLLIAGVPGMNTQSGAWWDAALPAIERNVLLSHLFLVHNFYGPTAINPPMWSIAVEWQIYFFFPLILLPVWRRGGPVAVILLAFGLGLMPHYFIGAATDSGYPWFLGLFALGMVGAAASFSSKASVSAWSRRFPWKVGAGGFAGIVILLTLLQRQSWANLSWIHWLRVETWGSVWPMDALVGLATACFLITLTHNERGITGPSIWNTWLRRPLLLTLGAFSYSLYLIHAPVLALVDLFNRKNGISGAAALCLIMAAGIPLSLAAAYLFHLAFERPFLRSRAALPVRSVQSDP